MTTMYVPDGPPKVIIPKEEKSLGQIAHDQYCYDSLNARWGTYPPYRKRWEDVAEAVRDAVLDKYQLAAAIRDAMGPQITEYQSGCIGWIQVAERVIEKLKGAQ